MQFCPQCKFMTYTKLNRNESPPILENYCKNCGWKGVKDISSKAIYKRNYKEDYIAEKVLSNKYTIFDVSLPRVEYDCINPKCATNTEFDKDSTLIVSNIPADHTDEQFDEIFESFNTKIDKKYRVKLTQAILVFKSKENKEEFESSFNKNIIPSYELSIDKFSQISKEILYIKYDPNNMKYIYLCANCGSSWNKN